MDTYDAVQPLNPTDGLRRRFLENTPTGHRKGAVYSRPQLAWGPLLPHNRFLGLFSPQEPIMLNRRRVLQTAGAVVCGLSILPLGWIAAAELPKGQRVFTAGHSFHMMISQPLAEMARLANITGHEIVGTQSIGGSRTQQHWDLPDEKNRAKQAIRTGKVDVLTLSPHLKLPDEGIDNFVKLCLEHNPESRVLLQASWMLFDDVNNRGMFKNEDRDRAKIEDLRRAYVPFDKDLHDQVTAINRQYQEKYKRPVVFLVPVGHAVMNLRERIVAGKVPGITRQSELFTDPIGHARPPLAVLNAYCHFAVIYRQSPVGLPVPSQLKKMEKAEELNRVLQEVAWEAVKNEPASGVK